LRAKINEKTTLKFAGDEVESWWDATRGSGSGPRILAGPALPVTADCNHVMLWMKQGATISIRASGTEPKIKVRDFPICFVIWVCGLHGVCTFMFSMFKL
jgi:phosphomannomutase